MAQSPDISKYGGSSENYIQSVLTITVATVRPADPFDVTTDAKNLNKAIEEEKNKVNLVPLIKIMARRTSAQRQQIILAYESLYKTNLRKTLKSKLKKNFQYTILVLLTPTDLFLAKEIHGAVDKLCSFRIDLYLIVQIICTATKDDIKRLNIAHKKVYNKALWDILKHKLKGKFKKLICMLMQATREDEGTFVDKTRIIAGANAIYRGGTVSADADYLIRIMTQRNFSHIRHICDEFERLSEQPLLNVVEAQIAGPVRDGLMCIIKCAYDRPGYFAAELHTLLTAKKLHHRYFIRIIASRCEIDLRSIIDAYEVVYDHSIVDDISKSLSGDYKDLVLALLGK